MSSTLESGQVFASRYTLLRRLAEGQSAETWLARDNALALERVIKIHTFAERSPEEARARFLAAAHSQKSLTHPNLLPCIDVGEQPRPFAVFEYIPAGDATRMRGRPWPDVINILRGIAEGTATVHDAGLVHRDLKLSNVLLNDAGRPMLTDFGLVASEGDLGETAAGSPFSASPQQAAGEPPARSDDIYSFGTLAYELLSGYPPHYAGTLAGDAGADALPPLRTPLPARLEQLLLRCLSPDVKDRPPNFQAIVDELAAVESQREDHTPARPAGRVGQLRIPQAVADPIEAGWQRATAAGPSEAELRSQGFKRGLLAGTLALLILLTVLVFFALPRWVARQAEVAAPVAPVPAVSAVPEGAAAPTGEAPDFQALAELKRQFDDLQPDLAAAYRQFDERDAARWGGEPFTQAGKHLEQADIAAAERDFEPALRALKQAQSEIEALAALATEKLGEAIKEGEAALAAGDAGQATAQFELALKIDPSSRQAQTGLKRAASLDDVRGLMAAAAALERDGKIAAAAEKYGEALRLDPEASAASDAIARLRSRMASDAFASAVAKGMAALAREDFSAARDSFQKAAAIRPGSAEASDGLARVERELASRRISDHLQQAQDAEQQERWAEALGEYREALKLDRNLMSAQQGVERTEPRAMIDAEMSAYIDRPDRLFSPEVREAAGKSLDKARTITVPGPKLARQMKTLSDLIDAAQRPVRVALASDKLTDVTIYRIGKLGAFESKEMELLPGRYTVVGSRQGYRDVRRELTVLPGSAPAVLVIRCEDRI